LEICSSLVRFGQNDGGGRLMTVQKAAIEVLRNANKPLHAKEIAKQMLAKGLWKTSGKTPEATVSARLYTDIKKKGESSTFIKVAPQIFALNNGQIAIMKKSCSNKNQTKKNALRLANLSFTDSAQKVLEEFGKRKPMHYREITEKALKKKWLVTNGKTPEATMYAQVITEIKRHQKRGEQPRFIQHGRGYVGLSCWVGQGLAFQIEQHNQKIRKNLLKRLLKLSPTEFEELIAQLLAEMGFESIEVTKHSGDGGIDVRGVLQIGDVIKIKMAVQAKKWNTKHRVQSPVVQQVRGSLGAHEQGLIITTSDFSKGAIQEANQPDKTPVGLINGEQLVALLVENNIGISRLSHDLIELS